MQESGLEVQENTYGGAADEYCTDVLYSYKRIQTYRWWAMHC